MIISPSIAKLAETPPIVGYVKTDIKGNFALVNAVNAALVFAICINENKPSCILAPPLAEKHINGVLFSIAYSTALTNFSPTAQPIEPPIKENSKAAAVTFNDSILP